MKITGLIREKTHSYKIWEVDLDILPSKHEIEVIEHMIKRLKSSPFTADVIRRDIR